MSRFDTSRFTISGTLVTGSPLAIGALSDELVDIPIQVDGMGVPIIPGTALAGALRARMPWYESVWGSGEQASSIVVDDAPWKPHKSEKQPVIDIRDGVSLNRYTRTAEVGFLYDYEVIPQGAQFDFNMTIDALDHAVVAELLAHLEGGFAVGRSTTKGLGRVSLRGHRVHKRDRSSREDLITLVTGGDSEPVTIETTPNPISMRASIAVPWQAHGPVLVADASLGDAIDIVPKAAGIWKHSKRRVSLVIPGSSTKGALRAHAESILRTVLDNQAENRPSLQSGWEDRSGRHMNDLRPDGGMHPIALLFGTAGERDGQGRRGAVTVSECTSVADWSWAQWSKVVAANKNDAVVDGFSQAQLLEALCKLDGPCRTDSNPTCQHLAPGRFVIGEHVAIDRWTGGAADGALYSVLEPWLTEPGDWTPLVLEIDQSMLQGEGAAPAAIYLLLLTLRDFCEGWIPLGYGSAKGYGQIGASASETSINGIGDSGYSLADVFKDEPPGALDEYRRAWLNWIREAGSDER